MGRSHPLYSFPIPYVKFCIEENQSELDIKNKSEREIKSKKLECELNNINKKLLPITEVMIGPMAYQKEAQTACRILLSERGYKNVNVEPSNIPYRGL